MRTKSNAVEARGFSLKRRATYFILPAIPWGEKVLIGAALAITVAAALARLALLFAG